MELKLKAPACDKDNGNGNDGSITVRNEYPRRPAPIIDTTKGGWSFHEKMARSVVNDIIIRNTTPKWVCNTFFDNYDQVEPILNKDSAQCFLQFFDKCEGRGMSWNLTITTLTLTYMISFNALRCAEVVLEGKAPELSGMRANPNFINKNGYFPLHEAAEKFSVEMIELLLRHGASANVRTVGNVVIENLLPLHVAVENTCLHKYLEDNLSSSQNHLDYIYKLIHLLYLPEMKIFLDTTRLLAEKTNNLLEEVWIYIEGGKLIQSAVLLLAAQEHIRGSCSSNINGSSKKDGFDIINKRLLVDVISHVVEPLSAYIQAHSETCNKSSFFLTELYRNDLNFCKITGVRMEVLEHVSSILKDYGFLPTEEVMDTINLQPYDCKMSDKKSCSKGANRGVMETAILHAAEEKAARTEVGGGWDPTYARRSYFPYWRSVLRTRCPVRVYPAYARAEARFPMVNGCTPITDHKLSSVGRITALTSNQPKRSFSTAAIGAFRLLKLLKHA
ncbi:hypothetical protein SETIT_2G261200v2 [Setaria italica]|uniref:Uncharacterized protein n=1 Tax=Setaria italica TaxID=4555 RepID=A0A368Q2S4_SETIT|nr:hypothetical protein SETIT_2G261200v2 [Setaria italica]